MGHILPQYILLRELYNLQFQWTFPQSSLLYTFFAWSIPKSREDEFKNKVCISTIWLMWTRPGTRTPVPEVIKFIILVHASLNIITVSHLADLRLWVEKKVCKEIHVHEFCTHWNIACICNNFFYGSVSPHNFKWLGNWRANIDIWWITHLFLFSVFFY